MKEPTSVGEFVLSQHPMAMPTVLRNVGQSQFDRCVRSSVETPIALCCAVGAATSEFSERKGTALLQNQRGARSSVIEQWIVAVV